MRSEGGLQAAFMSPAACRGPEKCGIPARFPPLMGRPVRVREPSNFKGGRQGRYAQALLLFGKFSSEAGLQPQADPDALEAHAAAAGESLTWQQTTQ